jgi:hypothetical protein
MENLPEDLQIVLTDNIYDLSKVSVIVLAYVNKFCYRISRRCAVKYDIPSSLVCHGIAAEGSLDVLKWARSNNCYWDFQVCAEAIVNGHLEILKWAHFNGCEKFIKTTYLAAMCGHLHILIWATSNGYVYDETTNIIAAEKKHIHILKWAEAGNHSWNMDIIKHVYIKCPEFFSPQKN